MTGEALGRLESAHRGVAVVAHPYPTSAGAHPATSQRSREVFTSREKTRSASTRLMSGTRRKWSTTAFLWDLISSACAAAGDRVADDFRAAISRLAAATGETRSV